MLPNCRSIHCKIIVCAHEFLLAERNFEEKSPFVQANYPSISHEISCELSSKLSSKNHRNKERNSGILLALLLHNTVGLILFDLTVLYNWSVGSSRRLYISL